MEKTKGLITMKGKPLTLTGNEVKVGDPAPDAELLANDLSAVKLSAFRGKVCIISSVPSLDTSVCSLETRRFNEQAGRLGDNVVILTVSMDLPFAQKRWCQAEGVESLQTLSDHRNASFGKIYGVLLKEMRLLARAVFVVGKDGIVRYKQIVKELTDEPDYKAAMEAVRELR
jgi:thiol peroxidase